MNNLMDIVTEKFYKDSNNFEKLLADKYANSIKTIISKGVMFDVLPFENELLGYHLKGKEILQEVIKDDCYKYHFDQENRIILIEQMSEFIGNFNSYTFYEYGKNYITTHYWSDNELCNITNYLFEKNGNILQSLSCGEMGKSQSHYFYENNVLTMIEKNYFELDDTFQSNIYFYFYYKNESLISILKGDKDKNWTECIYSTQKINFKKLEQQIFDDLVLILQNFNNKNQKTSAMLVQNYSNDKIILIGFEGETLSDIDSPYDWDFYDFANIELPDIPFDNSSNEKLLLVISNALSKITESDVFKKLNKNSEFLITIFDHDIEHIHKKIPKVKKVLKDNCYFNF